jgi:hypothetical protein
MKDEEISKYIYDFIDSHGGIEKAIQELERTEGKGPQKGNKMNVMISVSSPFAPLGVPF